jgi:signal transduction histidine kinase
VLRSEIPSGLAGGSLGFLYAEVTWTEIERFLEESVAGTGRTALLLGNTRHAIAAAGPLAEAAMTGAADLSVWRLDQGGIQPEIRDGTPLGAGALLLGEAAAKNHPHLLGFDWRLILVEPTGIAFAAIWRLFWAILGVLFLTLLLAAWFAARLSARIARPIGDLTAFAQGLDLSRTPSPPQVESGLAEVGELNRAFGEMLQALGRSREHLIRAGKLAVVGEMAAIMAHEVRTPLGILKSSAQLLERRTALDEADRELITYIGSETERLNRLVTTLLECASPRPPAFHPQDLHAILAHVVALLAGRSDKQGVALNVQAQSADPIVACDREQMVQVILNLVINAIQIVPEGGQIRIGTADAADAVLIRVEDDGPGIPEGSRERIFDPFFTRREGGVGLGLTIVRQIVESHHGEITVSRGPLGGACFTIRLPRAEGDRSS